MLNFYTNPIITNINQYYISISKPVLLTVTGSNFISNMQMYINCSQVINYFPIMLLNSLEVNATVDLSYCMSNILINIGLIFINNIQNLFAYTGNVYTYQTPVLASFYPNVLQKGITPNLHLKFSIPIPQFMYTLLE